MHGTFEEDKWTCLQFAARGGHVTLLLHLLCCNARIDTKAIENDKLGLLEQINNRLVSLRDGNGIGTTLMSEEERRFMWNLAFSFTIKPGGLIALKYIVRFDRSSHTTAFSWDLDMPSVMEVYGEKVVMLLRVKSISIHDFMD